MSKIKVTTRYLASLVVFLSLQSSASYALDSEISSFVSSASNQCNLEFERTKDTYRKANLQMKVISYDSTGLSTYFLKHSYQNGSSYSLWENLNGEVRGFAMRDDVGFDFNHDRMYKGPLTWQPTLIWNKLLDRKTDLSSFSCVLTGRTRVEGRKTTLIRLVPQDGLRYGYLLARDEESYLPIEIIVLDTSSTAVGKISVIDLDEMSSSFFPIEDRFFDEVNEKAQIKERKDLKIWKELNIPSVYKIVSSDSIYTEDGELVTDFQEFSDGITTFRVYKSPRISMYVPTANTGFITVYRKVYGDIEYAVVGEVTMKLAESILSKSSLN